jgi:hypothetical protein
LIVFIERTGAVECGRLTQGTNDDRQAGREAELAVRAAFERIGEVRSISHPQRNYKESVVTTREFAQIASDAAFIAQAPGYTVQQLAIQVRDLASKCDQLNIINVDNNLRRLFETCDELKAQVAELKAAYLKG